ncbi:MAG TPA: T9SS type A sorting domain-containing protein [Ignavibacteriaceae bacterium]|nr:T9SS type A sorting domain-containing protein [Ignavibacteriaceae bacterium]
MKKSYLLLLFSFLFIPLSLSFGQLFVEDFNYPVGDSLTGHGWTKHSGAAFTIFVQTGSLTYTGYPSSGIGNHVNIQGGSGSREDVNIGIDSLSANGDVIYYSFLANVASASATQDYFIHIGNRVSPTAFTLFAARVFVQDVSGNLRFGISNTSTQTMSTTNFSYNTTYLIFVKYTINTGGADECKLWVFSSGVPLSEALAGTPEVLNTATSGQDVIDAIALRQGGQAYSVLVDGIRVSTQWGDLVPVEFTSFSSVVDGSNVILNWSTATELNNFGFEVQRSIAGNEFVTVGFVNGHGTTTEAKDYRFVDANLTAGNYSYRLKQVDFNGTFSYSDEVNVDVTSPAQFELSQNYPNPFNPSTTIKFSIPQSSNVSLKIFNTLGQEVSTLINQNMESGLHTINFDASQLNSGIYFYKLDAGSYSQVKKMTLLK